MQQMNLKLADVRGFVQVTQNEEALLCLVTDELSTRFGDLTIRGDFYGELTMAGRLNRNLIVRSEMKCSR